MRDPYLVDLFDAQGTADRMRRASTYEKKRLKKLRSVSKGYRKAVVGRLLREAAEWQQKADLEKAQRNMNRLQINNYYAAMQNTHLANRCYPNSFSGGMFSGFGRLFSR